MTILTIVKEPAVFIAGAVVAVISPSDITAMTVAVGAFVTALGVVIVNIITARSAARQRDRQSEKIEETLSKTKVIEGHVNSEKTQAAGEITALQKEVAWLREVIAEKKETASLLAQAAAIPSTTKPGELSVPVLESIEKHTKDTAVNTLKTEAVVGEIKAKQETL